VEGILVLPGESLLKAIRRERKIKNLMLLLLRGGS